MPARCRPLTPREEDARRLPAAGRGTRLQIRLIFRKGKCRKEWPKVRMTGLLTVVPIYVKNFWFSPFYLPGVNILTCYYCQFWVKGYPNKYLELGLFKTFFLCPLMVMYSLGNEFLYVWDLIVEKFHKRILVFFIQSVIHSFIEKNLDQKFW